MKELLALVVIIVLLFAPLIYRQTTEKKRRAKFKDERKGGSTPFLTDDPMDDR